MIEEVDITKDGKIWYDEFLEMMGLDNELTSPKKMNEISNEKNKEKNFILSTNCEEISIVGIFKIKYKNGIQFIFFLLFNFIFKKDEIPDEFLQENYFQHIKK